MIMPFKTAPDVVRYSEDFPRRVQGFQDHAFRSINQVVRNPEKSSFVRILPQSVHSNEMRTITPQHNLAMMRPTAIK
jgi:hypothetical protein